jgi:hypothetical protein
MLSGSRLARSPYNKISRRYVQDQSYERVPEEDAGKMRKLQRAVVASTFVAAMIASGSALAANPTPLEQAEINQLSPALQAEVKTRMAAGGQKVSEILDTMLLNSVSKVFASGRVVAADFDKGVVVTEGTNGQLRSFNFDVATLITKP